MSLLYHHTQVARWFMALIALLIAWVAIASGIVGWHWITGLTLGLLLSIALLFHSLTVEIGDGRLRCAFGPGFISRTFALSDIRGVRAVRNRWYYGWGIRLMPTGWMFNLSGLDAVELTLASGKRFRIGTDEPDRLLAALRMAAGGRLDELPGSSHSPGDI